MERGIYGTRAATTLSSHVWVYITLDVVDCPLLVQVKHCALSLVGEPIFYPHVNRMLRLLHSRNISTFMVTNAQFPECIEALEPVTQLYVSIDAAKKEVLKAIDRPLFQDFWERFLASLESLKQKRQRTVYRLTLIKGRNMSELDDYAELIARGQPDFVEVKGVTYCGTSPGSDMTMKDVPYHQDVRDFCEALADKLNALATASGAAGVRYGLATEHAHSCCILLAKDDFFFDGTWHTHIDYPKFQQLVQQYYDSNGTKLFTSMDYTAPTPRWAVYNAPEAGFDPEEVK
jgi:tRNA wybutosine-synthesizing protein 1